MDSCKEILFRVFISYRGKVVAAAWVFSEIFFFPLGEFFNAVRDIYILFVPHTGELA